MVFEAGPNRRKFRSQTSDNMDRWKAEKGRGREKRKIRRKKSRRERVRRKQMQMREKVGKSRNTVFFQWFGDPEGRKVGSLKAAGAEPAGQMRDEKLHCGAKHISKSKCTKHTILGPLLEAQMSKKCTPSWREAHFQVKSAKNWGVRSTFGRSDAASRGRRRDWLCTLAKVSKNVRVLWHFQKRRQAWDIWRGSSKMHSAWQANYKRHVHQRC